MVDNIEAEVSFLFELMVRDYSNVFPKELPGLLLRKEIEFVIELEPNTVPISRAMYKMTLAGLQELKVQFQELLDKGFIRPSVSPLGCTSFVC